MKYKNRLWIPVASLLLLTATGASVFADLNANEIYSLFNTMNGGQGFRFSYSASSSLVSLTTPTGGFENVDNSAYINGRGGFVGTPARSYFYSFCLAPNLQVLTDGLGRINYDPVSGRSVTSQGNALTLGAAFLYKEYATSLTPLGMTGNVNATELALALRALMGISVVTDWTQNIYLNRLLALNSRTHWTQPYYANQRYSEIGDYSIFAMNVTNANGTGQYQDFIYIARATPDDVVPEPAMLLLWTLGGMGLYGSSVARKRRLKKLALS